ncbi:MAG: LysR family transcriptional regulator [Burkholderiales bacterium]|nr:LysR family transcriptional regulator [Burkholderiales bacterium]
MIAGMDLNLLRIFDAIMAERNVTRAANSLHMTQPAVSNALNRLRYELDDPLFIKTHNGVSPTQKSQLIWPVIRDALARINGVLRKNEFDPSTSQAEFRVAMSEYLTGQSLRSLLLAQTNIAPGVRIHLRPYTSDTATQQLERGEIDLAAGVYTGLIPSLRATPIDTLRFVLVMKRGHPLLQKPTLSMDDFLGAKHLSVNIFGTSEAPPIVDKELAAAGLRRNTFLTINHFVLVPEILAESDLVSVLPLGVARNSAYNDFLEIVEPPFKFQERVLSLIWHERTDSMHSHEWLRNEVMKACGAQVKSGRP